MSVARGRRDGFALPLLLFLLLALTALAMLALHAARQEVVIAGASVQLLETRLGAESAGRLAPRVDPEPLRAIPVGGSAVVLEGALGPRVRYRVGAHRVTRDFFFLEGVGRQEGRRGAELRVARVVWMPDAGAQVASFQAALESAARYGVGVVSGTEVTAIPAGWPPELCAPWRALSDSIFPAARIPESAIRAAGEEGAPLGLGILDLDALQPLAARRFLAGSPSDFGEACAGTTSPGWGTPSDPAGPCGDHLPLVHATGPLHLRDGEGQGILVVDGDLALSGVTRFTGILLVSGDLELEGSYRLEGFVRVGGSARLGGEGRIEANACAAFRAFDGNDSFPALLPLREGSWILPL
jgi:hypothetical protein